MAMGHRLRKMESLSGLRSPNPKPEPTTEILHVPQPHIQIPATVTNDSEKPEKPHSFSEQRPHNAPNLPSPLRSLPPQTQKTQTRNPKPKNLKGTKKQTRKPLQPQKKQTKETVADAKLLAQETTPSLLRRVVHWISRCLLGAFYVQKGVYFLSSSCFGFL